MIVFGAKYILRGGKPMLFLFALHNDRDDPGAAKGDEDLVFVRAAARGDTDAFSHLVSKYERIVYRTAYSIVGNAEDAADLSQEIFLRIWHGLPSFRADARFSTWLLRIARNVCADSLRKQQRTAPTEPLILVQDEEEMPYDPPDLSPDADPHAVYEMKETAADVRAALRSMSEEHRMLLLMRDADGMSYEEISSCLGLETGTVKSRLYRAREQLRQALRNMGYLT